MYPGKLSIVKDPSYPDERWVIKEGETLFDNALGYGYKTYETALKSLNFRYVRNYNDFKDKKRIFPQVFPKSKKSKHKNDDLQKNLWEV